MPRITSIGPIAVLACLAMAVGQPAASDITGPMPGVAAELAALAAQGTGKVEPYFFAVAPLGFAERASYDVELQPRVPARAESLALARLLPFSLVLDVALAKASLQTLDGIADAQGDQDASAIYFEQGPVFLSDIRAALVQLALPLDGAAAPGALTLLRPLVLSSRATLVLLPGERLVLDRAAGAFLLAAGGMIIDHASIVGSAPPNAHEENFRPFVLANATTGPVEVSGAQFERLGFGSDPRSAGISVTGGSAEPGRRSFVQDSSFSEMGSLSLVDAAQSTIRRNVFSRPFNTALAIATSASIIVDGNAVIGAEPGHGIKLGPNATDILVSDNIIAKSNKHGLLLEGNTTGSVIFNNLLFENQGSGTAVLGGTCLLLEQNLMLANAADGIMVRNSAGLSLETNLIAANRRAGISVGGDSGAVRLADNRFEANKIGLRASSSFDLSLSGNDWLGQTPRLFDGDIAQYTVSMLAGIKSGNGDLSMTGSPMSVSGAATSVSCQPEEAI